MSDWVSDRVQQRVSSHLRAIEVPFEGRYPPVNLMPLKVGTREGASWTFLSSRSHRMLTPVLTEM